MNITYNIIEAERINKIPLMDGDYIIEHTTVIEDDNFQYEKTSRKWKVINGVKTLIFDLKEEERELTNDEITIVKNSTDKQIISWYEQLYLQDTENENEYIEPDEKCPRKLYRAYQDEILKRFDFLRFSGCTYSKRKYPLFSIHFSAKEPIDKPLKELDLLLSVITPIDVKYLELYNTLDENDEYFNFFEYLEDNIQEFYLIDLTEKDLSAYGSYKVIIFEHEGITHYCLMNGRWIDYHTTNKIEFAKHIQKNYWYD